MLINKESLYALKIICYLSKQDKNRIVAGKEIADKEEISINFTLKILGILGRNDFVESFKGIRGGFKLKKYNINFYEIIKLIQKDIFISLEKKSEVEVFIHTVQENLKSMLENKII